MIDNNYIDLPDQPKKKINTKKTFGFDVGFDVYGFAETTELVPNIDDVYVFDKQTTTSILAGFILAFPYIIFEFWKFISPGLYENERKNARGFIFIASLLFFFGILFGYYIVTPLSINFLGNYSVSSEIFNDFDLNSYIGLLRASVLASGIIFELPIIVYFLTKIGIITPAFLRKNRKISLVLVLSLSAIITPPDIASQIIVSIPILVLYEVSILISRIVQKKQDSLTNKN